MREIKFRGWNATTSKMIDLHKITKLALSEGMNEDGLYIPFVNNIVLMQFVGLKDKADNDIYEGDIVKIHAGHPDKLNETYLAAFLDGAFGLKRKDTIDVTDFSSFIIYNSRLYENGYEGDCQLYMEVIGNIHQTPELLTKTL